MHVGQSARQTGGHGAADIDIVDMAAGEGDEAPLVEHRLPHDDVGRMRGKIARVGVVGDDDVAGLIAVFDERDGAAVVMAWIPGGAKIDRRGDGLAVGCRAAEW